MRIHPVPSNAVDILIVDDDASLRAGLRLLLEGHGYRCAEAHDGQAALTVAREKQPPCVLLDICLPGLDGFTVARRLRADLRTFAADIHCLTGLPDDDTQEQARRAGCNQVLTKPVDPNRLLEVVGQWTRPAEKVISCLTKQEAEDLLDMLENQGCKGLAVSCEDDGFTVRFICPPRRRLIKGKSGRLCLWRHDP